MADLIKSYEVDEELKQKEQDQYWARKGIDPNADKDVPVIRTETGVRSESGQNRATGGNWADTSATQRDSSGRMIPKKSPDVNEGQDVNSVTIKKGTFGGMYYIDPATGRNIDLDDDEMRARGIVKGKKNQTINLSQLPQAKSRSNPLAAFAGENQASKNGDLNSSNRRKGADPTPFDSGFGCGQVDVSNRQSTPQQSSSDSGQRVEGVNPSLFASQGDKVNLSDGSTGTVIVPTFGRSYVVKD